MPPILFTHSNHNPFTLRSLQPIQTPTQKRYRVIHTINDPDLRGKAVSCLTLEPTTERALLVVAHRNYMRMFDGRTYRRQTTSFSGVQSGRAMYVVFGPFWWGGIRKLFPFFYSSRA